MYDEAAIAIQVYFRRTREIQQYTTGIGARSDDEVVLELPLISVIDEVDAGVHVSVAHFGIVRNVRVPFFGNRADEVIACAGLLLQRVWCSGRSAPIIRMRSAVVPAEFNLGGPWRCKRIAASP